MPRTKKILGPTLLAAALFLGWVSVADAYYYASIKSSPTRPQGLPVWGWQPLGGVDDMGCKVGGTEQLGWLQAFGVLNQQTPPPNWPNGNAEGFIFYSDANCRLEQSEKVVYVKFDPNSVKPQVVNFRNLPWELDVETTVSLADSKYQSYREVRANDADLLLLLPEQVQQLPSTYAYPAIQYPDEGRIVWGGELMEQAVKTLVVQPPQQGTAPNPRATVFDALSSLMSGLGQDLGNLQELLRYADGSLQPGARPLNMGAHKASPVSNVMEFDTINMEQIPPNVNNNFNFNPAIQNTGMNVGPAQGNQNTMARIDLPLYGDTENNQQIGTRRRNRFNNPYFEEEEPESQNAQLANEQYFNLEDFEPLQDEFDPIKIMLSVLSKWDSVMKANEIINLRAPQRYAQDKDKRTKDRLDEAFKLMNNGMELTENIRRNTAVLIREQDEILAIIQDIQEEHSVESAIYQDALDAIQIFRAGYESNYFHSEEDIERYETISAEINQAQELYEGAFETLQRAHEQYSLELQKKADKYYQYYVKVFTYLRDLEIRLSVLRDELGYGEQSPVIIYGLRDDDTGQVYQPPDSYIEQIEEINFGGGYNLNAAQGYEESQQQSGEGEEIDFQQAPINSSPEVSGDVVSYTGGTNVNPDPSDFDPDSLA
ncbi:hypothetical protein TWF506_000118 [Arthrobotrys conoides]|uniref:Uncharacterized protein n=1 Tax=Arthrobotrys conoides TaxID=74498 RepID=A0AAN8RWE7_9PEZI